MNHRISFARLCFLACFAAVAHAGAAEYVRIDKDLVPALLAAPLEGSVAIPSWPIAPGVRANVVLTRHDVYSPEAVVYAVSGDTRVEVPRSRLHFLWGSADDEEGTPVLVVADPDASTLHGYSGSGGSTAEIRRVPEIEDEYAVASAEELAEAAEEPPVWKCADADEPEPSRGVVRESLPREAITSLHRATLAVDTDNELLSLKFGDDTTAATNYVASLFALLTAIYERDLLVRVLQGTTFLRVSAAADPYALCGTGNVDLAKLDEFRNWWIANQAGVPRAAAMMLSGKQGSSTAASGMSYVNTLCSTTHGYSFTQVFKYAGSSASSDARMVAHEIGHTFGSRHTHCYTSPTPIDTCYGGESGCYSGATACPSATTINGVANVKGTIMSYCHSLSGCSSSTVFHPRTVEIIAPILETKAGVCVFPMAAPQEASPAEDLTVRRGTGSALSVSYSPACGASGHTVYAGDLDALRASGISWSQRHCALGTSGSLAFDPGGGNVYFVVVGNNGSTEGSYGKSGAAERPAAGAGGACSYAQSLGGSCP